jgi:AcrR family transcriptional regulator
MWSMLEPESSSGSATDCSAETECSSVSGDHVSLSTVTKPATDKTMRADARRNRERLLAAALELFAEAGTEVSRETVANRAGVGIGTVYRHFPTHDALVEATYRNEVAQLRGAVDELLRDRPADAALAEWMDRFVDYAARKRGMAGALRSVVASGSDVYADTRRQIVAALTALLEAGAADGTVRADVDAEDVLSAMSAIWLIRDDAAWADQARRVLMLVMDGLRHGAAG